MDDGYRYPKWWEPAPNPSDPNAAAFRTGGAQPAGTGLESLVEWARSQVGDPRPAVSGAAQSGVRALSNNAGLGGLLGGMSDRPTGAGGLPPAYLNPFLLGLLLNGQQGQPAQQGQQAAAPDLQNGWLQMLLGGPRQAR